MEQDLYENVVLTTRKILSGESNVLFVSHDSDDGIWQCLDGELVREEDACIISFEEMVDIDKTIHQIRDLPLGFCAYRTDIAREWTIKKNREIEVR